MLEIESEMVSSVGFPWRAIWRVMAAMKVVFFVWTVSLGENSNSK